MKFSTHIHGPQVMNPNDVGDLMTFPQALPADIPNFVSIFMIPRKCISKTGIHWLLGLKFVLLIKVSQQLLEWKFSYSHLFMFPLIWIVMPALDKPLVFNPGLSSDHNSTLTLNYDWKLAKLTFLSPLVVLN